MNRNERRSPEGRNSNGTINDIQEDKEHSVEDAVTTIRLDHLFSEQLDHPPQPQPHLQPPHDHGRPLVDEDNNANNSHNRNSTTNQVGGTAGRRDHSSKRPDKDQQRQIGPKQPLRLSTSLGASAFHIHDNPGSAVLPKMPVTFNNGSSSSSFVDTMTQQLSIHVEQPVGSMSISPSSRDVVLAAYVFYLFILLCCRNILSANCGIIYC